MTDKSMLDILSNFTAASSDVVTEGTRTQAKPNAMKDILSKFYSVAEAYPEYSGVTPDEELDTSNLEFDTRSMADRIEQDGSISDTYDIDATQVSSPNVAQMAQQIRHEELQDDVNESDDQQLDPKAIAFVLEYMAKNHPEIEVNKQDVKDFFVNFMQAHDEVNEDENDMPASGEEAEMAGDQIEYIKYAIDEIKDSIEAGNSFPEWFQNKLSGVYTTLKDLHGYMEGDKRNDADEMMFDDAPDMSDRMQQLRGMRNRDAEANFAKTHAKHGIDGAAMSSRMHSDALAHAGEFADPRKLARGAMNMGMSPEQVDRALPADFKFDEDVVSKKQAAADVVGKKTAVDDVVKELAKSYADFVAQVEEEKDDMSFFKKGK